MSVPWTVSRTSDPKDIKKTTKVISHESAKLEILRRLLEKSPVTNEKSVAFQKAMDKCMRRAEPQHNDFSLLHLLSRVESTQEYTFNQHLFIPYWSNTVETDHLEIGICGDDQSEPFASTSATVESLLNETPIVQTLRKTSPVNFMVGLPQSEVAVSMFPKVIATCEDTKSFVSHQKNNMSVDREAEDEDEDDHDAYKKHFHAYKCVFHGVQITECGCGCGGGGADSIIPKEPSCTDSNICIQLRLNTLFRKADQISILQVGKEYKQALEKDQLIYNRYFMVKISLNGIHVGETKWIQANAENGFLDFGKVTISIAVSGTLYSALRFSVWEKIKQKIPATHYHHHHHHHDPTISLVSKDCDASSFAPGITIAREIAYRGSQEALVSAITQDMWMSLRLCNETTERICSLQIVNFKDTIESLHSSRLGHLKWLKLQMHCKSVFFPLLPLCFVVLTLFFFIYIYI